jgi:hypothetical protein
MEWVGGIIYKDRFGETFFHKMSVVIGQILQRILTRKFECISSRLYRLWYNFIVIWAYLCCCFILINKKNGLTLLIEWFTCCHGSSSIWTVYRQYLYFLNPKLIAVERKGKKTCRTFFSHCITHFSCQILSFIHAVVLHTNRLKVDADYIPELGFFSLLKFWEPKGVWIMHKCG